MARGRRAQRRTRPLIVREATKDDVDPIAADLPDETHAELVALTGLKLVPSLLVNYSDSKEVVYVETSGPRPQAIALGGVAPDDDMSPSAQVWLVCTRAANRSPVALVRALHEQIQMFGQRYGLLYGYVDARNETRARWLEVLGFEVNREEELKLGYLGLPFFQFISTSPR